MTWVQSGGKELWEEVANVQDRSLEGVWRGSYNMKSKGANR
jgi:hypothetical protein